MSKSPTCNPLENCSDAGVTLLYFVPAAKDTTEIEKLFQILIEASRLTVYDIYEFNKQSQLGTGTILRIIFFEDNFIYFFLCLIVYSIVFIFLGRYAEIYDCPSNSSSSQISPATNTTNATNTPSSFNSIPIVKSTELKNEGSTSHESKENSDTNHPTSSRIAIKLIKKKEYVISVNNHEERPCTILREIVLLWRANYKVYYNNEEQRIESNLQDRPFMKIYGIMETR